MTKRKIKPGEKIAMEYFQSIGYTNIQYEPEPNCPPDLLLDEKIAVEVRRLNQFKHINGANKPLEDLEYQIMPRIRNLIKTFDHIPSQQTSWISVKYQRPLKVDKKLLEAVERALRIHMNRLDQHFVYPITPTLEIRCRPSASSINYNKPFMWASSFDGDSGGLVVGMIYRSLKHIVMEKEGKIQPHRNKYPTWWLAVTDHIGYGLDDKDVAQLKEGFDIETFFEKIIFISPFDSSRGKEIICGRPK